MSTWTQRFDSHALWTNLSRLRDELADAEPPDDQEGKETFDYTVAVAAAVGSRRDETDALLVTPSALTGTELAIEALRTALQNWLSGAWTAAQHETTVEAVIQSLTAWPAPTTPQTIGATRQALDEITSATARALTSVAARRDELESAISDLDSKQATLESLIAEQGLQVNNSIAVFEKDSKTVLDNSAGEWERERTKHGIDAFVYIDRLAALEKEARELVHAGTSSIVATDYGRYARNKTVAAWTCDIAAALVGAAGVAAILVHLYRSGLELDGNIGLSITRLGASLGTLGIAALIGRRGQQHHQEARAAKRTDLALRQVGPFTANLSKETRELVIQEITDRIFIKGALDNPEPSESLVTKVRRLREDQASQQTDA